MLATGERPRQLHWYHAGPMLFGDWGTSRLYVLGIAFFASQFASFWFLLAMSGLLLGVGWAYEVICRHYPEGGGVYSAARHRSHFLGVVGALLLCADYVVTASLSALDAFHYLHLPHAEIWAAIGIMLIGVINYFGPTKAGTLAMYIALATVGCSLLIAFYAAPSLSSAKFTPAPGNFGNWWSQFSGLILAISGVEAVANMTGIMVKPVQRTARLSIYPVLAEIVILNLVLTVAMQALPADILGVGNPERMAAVRDTMLRVLSEYYIGPTFAFVASFVFAGLLLSAVNTAVTDLVSIQYMMAHDQELPPLFAGLNKWGMPVVGLMLGTVVPIITVLMVPDVGHLADLYAIGVVGAVAINLGACSTNFKMDLKAWERWPMVALAALMIAIWITIAYEKPHALLFAGSILLAGLFARYVAHNYREIGQWMLEPVPSLYGLPTVEGVGQGGAQLIYRGADYVPAFPAAQPAAPTEARSETNKQIDSDKLDSSASGALAAATAKTGRVMVCTHGNPKLIHFALDQAKLRNVELLVLFVRHLAVAMPAPLGPTNGNDDNEALKLFATSRELGEAAGVKVFCLYAMSYDIADTILEMAVTHGVTHLVMGATQRGGIWRAMKGDVIQEVAQYLPEPIELLITA